MQLVASSARLPLSLALSMALGGSVLLPTQGWAQTPDGPLIPGLEESIEDGVEDDVTDDLQDVVEEELEEQVEEQVESGIDQSVEENVEGEIQEDIEDRIEATIEENLELSVEDVIEQSVEQNVTQFIEMTTEEFLEVIVGDAVEETVQASVEESVEEAVADSVEQVVESGVEQVVESSVEQSVEESVEESVESAVEEQVLTVVEANVEDMVRDSVEANIESSLEETVEEDLASSVEVIVEEAVADRLDNRIDRILDDIESGLDVDEDRIQKDQWLVMAEPEVFQELAEEGYIFNEVTDLPGLGLRLAEVAAPSSFDINKVREGVMDIVGKDRAEVDLNHIYTAGIPKGVGVLHAGEGMSPRTALSFPEDTDGMALRIGMIDSQVDVDHPALNHSNIETRAFTRLGAELPEFHGTAIASIIAADDEGYRGLAPMAKVYAAAVFENDAERGEIASTVSLVRALDWLMSSGVDAVNISLAGPPNRLLEAALARAARDNMLLLAAAGNGGPVAKPMFPAAYDSVVAVTAVDASGKVFRLANRGEYLDLAAPGVGLLHAEAGGGYTTSSGTSFAVPFAATAAARMRHVQPEEDTMKGLFLRTEDVGPPGRDEIYGRGLLRP